MVGNNWGTWEVRGKKFRLWDGQTTAGRVWSEYEYEQWRDHGQVVYTNDNPVATNKDKAK